MTGHLFAAGRAVTSVVVYCGLLVGCPIELGWHGWKGSLLDDRTRRGRLFRFLLFVLAAVETKLDNGGARDEVLSG